MHDRIVLLGKYKLITTKVLISKASIGSYISHDEFVSKNKVLREYYETKEEVIHSINRVDISREEYERNGIETIVDNEGILRLNKKHIEERLAIKICEKFP